MNDIINLFNADMFPAINLLLKILISMPASVATAERSFSSLRRIKTWLRNNMTEERLSGLACINAHPDIEINIENVIDRFANSTRRLDFVV